MATDKVPPSVLYKYMGKDRADFFKNCQIAFSARSTLNDVFEMQPSVSLQFLGTATIEEQQENERMVNESLGEARILCLSESWDIIPMWSYYAQAHQGFAVGLGLSHSFFDGREPRQVKYCDSYPVVTNKIGFEDAVFTKFEQWQHEREWRSLAVPSEEDGRFYDQPLCRDDVALAEFPPDLIVEVIFGHRMEQSLRKCLLKYLFTPKFKHVKIYQAKPVEHAWKLELDEIPLEQIPAILRK